MISLGPGEEAQATRTRPTAAPAGLIPRVAERWQLKPRLLAFGGGQRRPERAGPGVSRAPATAPATAPAAAAIPWRAVVAQALGMWLATRVAFALFTYFAVTYFAELFSPVGQYAAFSPRALLHAWQQWDASWYLNIAQHGYWEIQATGFFPLYPMLIRVATFVLGDTHSLTAALLVANLGTLGAFVALGLLAAGEDGSETSAWRAIRVAAAYPLAFFLAAPYTEGLFLAFAAGSLFCARRGAWLWAALWAFLAGLTRPTSIVLILPLLWEFGRQHDWWRMASSEWWRQGHWRAPLRLLEASAVTEAAAVMGAVPLAIGLFALYCWQRFGDPLIFLRAQRIYWSHMLMPPWQGLSLALGHYFAAPAWTYLQSWLLVDLAPLAIFALLTLATIRRIPFAFTLYMLGLLYMATATPLIGYSDTFRSVGRYLLASAPIFLLLGRWTERRPWLDLLIVSGGFLLQAVFTLHWLLGQAPI